ncbi:hypothetical protein K7X08_002522 [Anisodus acutangulus]|uniref:Aminotransferase-like plant mobile domain-containing protein n=1 Tax=Anisodus acutangulus TaxID=402998 RepID=A0A9Q1LPC9_9SOLA|nr:hypothetical protein K7X08_002522 [Anisodus acutangulus]
MSSSSSLSQGSDSADLAVGDLTPTFAFIDEQLVLAPYGTSEQGDLLLSRHLSPTNYDLPITCDWFTGDHCLASLCTWPAKIVNYFVVNELEIYAALAISGEDVSWASLFLTYLYMALDDAQAWLRDSKNLDTLVGPLWFLQLWINLYFPEFIPDDFDDRCFLLNLPVLADTLRKAPLVPQDAFSAVSTLHGLSRDHYTDWQSVFERWATHDWVYQIGDDNLTFSQQRTMALTWGCILTARDLLGGLKPTSRNNKLTTEPYRPNFVARQFGLTQHVPWPHRSIEQQTKLQDELERIQLEIKAITLSMGALKSTIKAQDSSYSSLFRQGSHLDNKIRELGNQHVVWELDQKAGSERLAQLENDWTAWKNILAQATPTLSASLSTVVSDGTYFSVMTTLLPIDFVTQLSADILMDLQSKDIAASVPQEGFPREVGADGVVVIGAAEDGKETVATTDDQAAVDSANPEISVTGNVAQPPASEMSANLAS